MRVKALYKFIEKDSLCKPVFLSLALLVALFVFLTYFFYAVFIDPSKVRKSSEAAVMCKHAVLICFYRSLCFIYSTQWHCCLLQVVLCSFTDRACTLKRLSMHKSESYDTHFMLI